MKVLICWKDPRVDNPVACHAGLGVTARNAAECLTEQGIDATASAVADGYFIRDGLRAGKWGYVTHLVMCAPFFDTKFLETLCNEFPKIQFAVVFHSNVGFLGVDNWSSGILAEQIGLERKIPNFHVAGNAEKFCQSVQQAFRAPCALLPNLYFLHGPIQRKRAPWSGGPLKIGAFGATRILKNLPTAAWAACIVAQKLNVPVEFHVSEGRAEGSGSETVINGIRKVIASVKNVSLIEDKWSPWLQFRMDVVRRMNIMMQPSFTESFNGVTADGIAEGVPSVVGQAIDWVPASWVANPDDATDVARVAISLIRDKNAPRDGYRALEKHNHMAIESWQAYLSN